MHSSSDVAAELEHGSQSASLGPGAVRCELRPAATASSTTLRAVPEARPHDADPSTSSRSVDGLAAHAGFYVDCSASGRRARTASSDRRTCFGIYGRERRRVHADARARRAARPDIAAARRARGKGTSSSGDVGHRRLPHGASATPTATPSSTPLPAVRVMQVEHVDFVSVPDPGHPEGEAVLLGGPGTRDRDRGRERHGVSLRPGHARRLRSVEHRPAFRAVPRRACAASRRRRRRPGGARGERRDQFDGETIETSVCRQAWFKDPDGNALMLHPVASTCR